MKILTGALTPDAGAVFVDGGFAWNIPLEHAPGLGATEIYVMQVRAIVEATLDCQANGIKAMPEIMHPLVAYAEEHGHRRIFTLDSDFDVYRIRGRQRFDVVPSH